MQVPKRKTSKSKRNMRRAHHALTPVRSTVCKNCGEPVAAHHVCTSCGHYRGRKVIAAGEATAA